MTGGAGRPCMAAPFASLVRRGRRGAGSASPASRSHGSTCPPNLLLIQ